jgi:four helix bundle protein
MTEKEPLYHSPGVKGKRGFEDLECYQLALEVVVKIHAFSQSLSPSEKFDLFAQIRRSAKGVTGNIGEAYGRYHYLDCLHYYSIARGELYETLAHLINAKVLNYIDQPSFESLYTLIRQTEQALNGFMTYVRRQKAGVSEFGDRVIREEPALYFSEEDE